LRSQATVENRIETLQYTQWYRLALAAIFFLVAVSSFFGPLDISKGDELMTVGIDKTVLIKLGISGLAFLVGA
jgi:hypothetical protein